ncbi:carboxypeptidase-like regulatory domain-containing protein [Hymenobacter defluvii]|uniref:Carboxypeptidase-like regulatory domain-containing protein n=1 Tax=Hymenobacter defluvii TaxID=2054411 RepID=A0ABS3TCY4_9BACT|nr:carboxypeptidase-like regulatory domain-containing protein [Hymenobacter defluvii]MBO3271522.1 carboxypeptidase-like regulatory domain-containing protein [Hymenobacter defluvii]
MLPFPRLAQLQVVRLLGLLLLLWLWSAGAAQAQVRVTGTVSDAETRKPVPRVTVLLQGKGQGVIASDQGDFNLTATARDTLVFQALGYKTQRLVVGNSGLSQIILQIKLQPASIELQSVEVRQGRPSDAVINRALRNMKRPTPPDNAVKRPAPPKPLFPVDSTAPKSATESASIQNPVSLLYEQFSREGKQRQKMEEIQAQERLQKALKARREYNKYFLDNRGYE